MPRPCFALVGLLAVLTSVQCLAQTAEDLNLPRLPSVDQSPERPPFQAPGPAPTRSSHDDAPVALEGPEEEPAVISLDDFLGYRYASSSLDWIPGSGNQFGMFSIVLDRYVKSGIEHGIGLGAAFHFLGGPEKTDMPPRLYDFSAGYQFRRQLGPLKFDLAAAVQASSDFEGSARKGILFPGHAVGFLTIRPQIDVVFGVDYVDRGDIKLLPVVGVIWNPRPDMRYELVFPRPRAVFQLTDGYRLYLSGELGGGTWAIERPVIGNDLATYRDLRACIGVEHMEKDGQRSAIELGYLFGRRLEYTSEIGDTHLVDSVVLRLVTTF